uniref:Small ubiquitin like modifier 4 n=1 Tax=Chrysemys picta bellii TaxID=8478 RepID=A0A8C3J140_CHRPI
MADEKPKEGVKTENNDHINLKVAGQDGSVVQFKIKRHTPLSKLMKAYCERQLLLGASGNLGIMQEEFIRLA